MPISTKERTDLRAELVSQGYSWKYIDEWQPKITLYRHREMRNPSGELVSEVGARIEGLPGQPDFVTRKARQGLLQWPPSESCICRWCQARQAEGATKAEVAQVAEAAPEPVETGTGKGVFGPHFKT